MIGMTTTRARDANSAAPTFTFFGFWVGRAATPAADQQVRLQGAGLATGAQFWRTAPPDQG